MSRRGYTESECSSMVKIYEKDPTLETVHLLAVKMRRTRMSIITKLVALGVYRRKVYLTKQGERPRMKKTILSELEDFIGMEGGGLSGLEIAKKESLVNLDVNLRAFFHELEDENLELIKKVETLDLLLKKQQG